MRKWRLRIFLRFLKIVSTKKQSKHTFIQCTQKNRSKWWKVKCSWYLSCNVNKHCSSHSLATSIQIKFNLVTSVETCFLFWSKVHIQSKTGFTSPFSSLFLVCSTILWVCAWKFKYLPWFSIESVKSVGYWNSWKIHVKEIISFLL